VSAITGYFEGVRIVPDWQSKHMLDDALAAALMAGLASLLCGAVIYPVIVHLSADNERKALEVLDSHISMMDALGRAIAKRDSDTGAHNYRVAWIAARIAEEMGLRDKAMQSLIAGSFLHDVGKIGIPDAILLKPGKLDDAEFTIMRTHVDQGEEIVTGMGWLDGAHAVVAGHHEKWNGSGYPRRLQGEAIPLPARIFAVADVFDALCSKRPYKEPMSFEAAMAILDKDTGSHFDPSVMAVFRPMASEIHATLAGCDEEATRQLLQNRIRTHFGV
jgi:HD-GYP domain-containing protein (c-di-GMP phosphodiesterase class II)